MRWLIALLGACAAAKAQVINAASCSSTDVQAAFNSAVNSTTTINIPAGTCHWTVEVTFNIPSSNAGVSVLGAGSLTTVGGGNSTVIIDDIASNNDALLAILPGNTASALVRFAGITLQGGTGLIKDQGLLKISGISSISTSVRVDHDHFDSSTYTPASKSGMGNFYNTYGVIDHCIIDLISGTTINGPKIHLPDTGGQGDLTWSEPTQFGSANFMFAEDNQINGGSGNDCDQGGRYVFRHNTFTDSSVQTHPTGGAGRARGCRGGEVYSNTFNTASTQFNVFFLSSGTWLIWGNTSQTYTNFIGLHSMRRDNSTYPESATPTGWGYCGTSFNGTGSNWDQNTSASTGYRCLDQPGSGVGQLIAGAFPNALNQTTGTIAWTNEALEPVYEWLNTFSPASSYSVDTLSATVLSANTDYYAYTGSFTGASGTGSGTLAARPSTCTTKTAYWATDTQTLYQCSSANTWTTYYTPYTYPHPLVGGTAGGSTILGSVTISGSAQVH